MSLGSDELAMKLARAFLLHCSDVLSAVEAEFADGKTESVSFSSRVRLSQHEGAIRAKMTNSSPKFSIAEASSFDAVLEQDDGQMSIFKKPPLKKTE